MNLTHADLLKLKRWNTPTIYNGWEQITASNAAADAFNVEETRDFMPAMGPMVGYAITVVIEPSNASHKRKANAWDEYRRYVAGVDGPKIVIVQDLDKPQVIGSYWGEVNSNIHKGLGCLGLVTDGSVRDLPDVASGFQMLAGRVGPSHAYVHAVAFGIPINVAGMRTSDGDLIHADPVISNRNPNVLAWGHLIGLDKALIKGGILCLNP